jgi:hypothetical protein
VTRKIPAFAVVAFPTHGLKVFLLVTSTRPLRIDVILSHHQKSTHTILMVQIQVRNVSFDVVAVAKSAPRTIVQEAVHTHARRSRNVLLQEKDGTLPFAPHARLVALQTFQAGRACFDPSETVTRRQQNLGEVQSNTRQNFFHGKLCQRFHGCFLPVGFEPGGPTAANREHDASQNRCHREWTRHSLPEESKSENDYAWNHEDCHDAARLPGSFLFHETISPFFGSFLFGFFGIRFYFSLGSVR